MYHDVSAPHADHPAASGTCQPVAVPDVFNHCRRIAGRIGAASFGVFFVGSLQEGGDRLVPVFDSEFPGLSLLSRQVTSRLSEGFCRAATAALTPIWWPAGNEGCGARLAGLRWAEPVERPATEVPGLAFPVVSRSDRCGVVVFAGAGIVIDDAALCETHRNCIAMFEDVVRWKSTAAENAPSISKRELECLRLTANGLTSEDIAAALGLSVHTANQYLTNTAHKLNAVNRIHAVAKALRTGLID